MAERVIVVGGGVRSGKSRFALELALKYPAPRVFLATAQARDQEMQRRVHAHQLERGDAFETREVELDLAGGLQASAGAGVVVVDCMTLYVSNLLLAASCETPSSDAQLVQPELEALVTARLDAVAQALRATSSTVILVTNEVGMGVVPPSPLGRSFRDLLGLANQCITRDADELYLATLGVVLRLKPNPVALMNAE